MTARNGRVAGKRVRTLEGQYAGGCPRRDRAGGAARTQFALQDEAVSEGLASRSCERAKAGGEGGIRTLGRGFSPYNGLANRRLQPLGHLTARLQVYVTSTLTRKPSIAKR